MGVEIKMKVVVPLQMHHMLQRQRFSCQEIRIETLHPQCDLKETTREESVYSLSNKFKS